MKKKERKKERKKKNVRETGKTNRDNSKLI